MRAMALVALVVTACGGGSDEPEPPDAAAAEGTATIPPETAPTTTVPAPPACPPSGAAVSVRLTDAAMGLRYMVLALTNCGDEPYSVSGYPEIVLLDEDGEPYEGVELVHGPRYSPDEGGFCTPSGRFDDGPQTVQLTPGAVAQAGVEWRNTTADEFHLIVNAPAMAIVPAPGEEPQELTPDGPIDRHDRPSWPSAPGDPTATAADGRGALAGQATAHDATRQRAPTRAAAR